MKCEICFELLEQYLDGELPAAEQEQVGAHLITCADCSSSFAALTAEQELFSRYDREVEVPPFLWTRIAAHTVSESAPKNGWRAMLASIFASPAKSVVAILLLTIGAGVVYLMSRQAAVTSSTTEKQSTLTRGGNGATPDQRPQPRSTEEAARPDVIASKLPPRGRTNLSGNRTKLDRSRALDQSDILSADLEYPDMDERDTAKHIEQSQNLLRSIRNFPVSDGDDEIDVSYDKALSRRLLNENVVLRREAEMKAKFPTKTLLADLEPFLIDIANLPDRARPEDVRAIKERVQKTEIVAALLDYRGTNNRY